MLQTALYILSGNSASAVLLLARNLLVARLISVEDYGIAATFALTMAVVEMITQLGLQQHIVQARDGNDPRFQAALQGFQLIRGLIGGAIVVVLAWPLANFLNVPHLAWAYQVLAVVPVLNAFTHFDVHRLNREMVFWPLLLTGAVPAFISFVVIWPLSLLFDDYRVMLYSLVLQATVTAVTSHLAARRKYYVVFDPAIISASLRFGWPLLINSVLLFVIFNGDKFVVGRVLGMETLGVFAMGFTLTLTPTLVMDKSAQTFFLPKLSEVDRSSASGAKLFQRYSVLAMQVSVLNGATLVLAVMLFGEIFVMNVLGQSYATLVPLLVPMAIMQAFRVAKAGCSVTALSSGHTANAMIVNFFRLASMPLAWYFLLEGHGLQIVILVAIFAESIGYGISLFLVSRRPGIQLHQMTSVNFFLFTFIIFSVFVETRAEAVYKIFLLGLFALLFFSMQNLRRFLFRGHGAQPKR